MTSIFHDVSAKRHESHFALQSIIARLWQHLPLPIAESESKKRIFYICIFVAAAQTVAFKVSPNVWNPYSKLLKMRESCLQKRTTKCRDNLKRLSQHLQKLLVFFKNVDLVSFKNNNNNFLKSQIKFQAAWWHGG